MGFSGCCFYIVVAEHKISAEQKKNDRIARNAECLSEVGVYLSPMDQDKDSGEIEEVGDNKHTKKSNRRCNNFAFVPEGPRLVEEEADSQADGISKSVRGYIPEIQERFCGENHRQPHYRIDYAQNQETDQLPCHRK